MEIRFTAKMVEGPIAALAVAPFHHGRDQPTSSHSNWSSKGFTSNLQWLLIAEPPGEKTRRGRLLAPRASPEPRPGRPTGRRQNR